MMKFLAVLPILLVLAAAAVIKQNDVEDNAKEIVQNYDGFDWKKYISSFGDEDSSFDWKSYLPYGGKAPVQHYDWKQWLSKKSGKKSVSTSDVSATSVSKGGKGDFDWKKYISSYGQPPQSIADEYSINNFDWEKYLSFGGQAPVQYYDWKQWLSKSSGKSSSGSKSKNLSKSSTGKRQKYTPRPRVSTSTTKKSSKGGYDWKQWLSRSSVSASASKVAKSTSGSTSGGYNWKQWLSKSGANSISVSGKGGKYDWKQWLSKGTTVDGTPEPEVVTTEGENKMISSDDSTTAKPENSGNGGYDWKQWLSKSFGSETGSGKEGGFDWKKFLSNSYAEPPSSIQEQYSFSTFDWNKYLSGSQ